MVSKSNNSNSNIYNGFMSIIIILVAVVSAIKIFHHDDSFQTLERTHRHTHRQTHTKTDRPRCRVDSAFGGVNWKCTFVKNNECIFIGNQCK